MTEPSDTQREEKKTDSAGSKICDQGSSVRPHVDVQHPHSSKHTLLNTEEEREDGAEDEEGDEEDRREGSSGLAAAKQVLIKFDCIVSYQL